MDTIEKIVSYTAIGDKGILGGLMGGGKQPKPDEVPVAPTGNLDEARRVASRMQARKYASTGRVGTALTEDSSLG